MNKLYIIAGIIALQCFTATNCAEKKDRMATYRILYRLVQQKPINWPAIFTALDNSQEPVNVNNFTIPMTKESLLEAALMTKDLIAAEILLKSYNAMPNMIRNEVKITPMMLMCIKGDIEAVELLLDNGGDPNLYSRAGLNCFDLAKKHPAVLELLKQYKTK